MPYKIFVKVFVNFSMYIKFSFSVHGIYLLSKTMYCLRTEQFLLSIVNSNFDDLFDYLLVNPLRMTI